MMRLCHLREKHIALLRGRGHKVECAVCRRPFKHGDLVYHRTASNRTKIRRSKVKLFCPDARARRRYMIPYFDSIPPEKVQKIREAMKKGRTP